MKQEDLCPGKAEAIWKRTDIPELQGYQWFSTTRPHRIKRITMKCEICGRKMLSSVQLYHDGGEIVHSLPPHKPKGWWKKKIAKKRKDKNDHGRPLRYLPSLSGKISGKRG